MKKLSRIGKNIFYGIEGVLVGLVMIGVFKYYALSLIALALLTINTKFISDHTEA